MAQAKIPSPRYRSRLSLLLALLTLLPATAQAESGAPPRFGTGFGINIKTERITEPELDIIAAVGIKRVRTGFSWYEVERRKDDYAWDSPIERQTAADDYENGRIYFSHDIAVKQIRARGLHIDATLNQGNGVYTGKPVNIEPEGKPPSYRLVAPRTPETIAGFAAFAAATVQHYEQLYGRDAFTWHIWNEPDFKGGFPPEIDAAIFGKLVLATCEAIRKVDPQAEIMGPALGAHGDGDIQLDFIKTMLTSANSLSCLDGFTVHPYRSAVPETAPDDYAKVAAVLAPLQPPGKPPVPVATDEWGYSIAKTHGDVPSTQRWRDFSAEEQAALMLRMYLTNLAHGVPLTVIYDWRDRGPDPYEWEDNFGLMGYKGEEKPALKMFRSVWPLLLNRPLLAADEAEECSPHEHVLLFGPSPQQDDEWLVAWTDDKPRALQLSGNADRIVDIFGKPQKAGASLTLTGSPVLLRHSDGLPVTLSCAAAGTTGATP